MRKALVLAAFLLPLNAVRPLGLLTAADLMLLGCAVLAMRQRPAPRPPRGPGLSIMVVGLLVILVGQTARSYIYGDVDSVLTVMRPLSSALLPVLLLARLRPSPSLVRTMTLAYAAGAAFSALSAVLVLRDDYLQRAYGLATHPNHLGLTCALGASLALGFVHLSSSKGAWPLAVVLSCVSGVVVSGSRAALIAVLFGIGYHLVVNRKRRTALIAAGCLLLPLLLGASPGLPANNALVRLAALTEPAALSARLSDAERRKQVGRAMDRFADQPAVGAGFRHSQEVHSIYLQTLSGFGILGACGLGLALTPALLGLVRVARQGATLTCPVGVGTSAATVTFLVDGLAQNILWDRYVWTVLALQVLATRPSTMTRLRAAE